MFPMLEAAKARPRFTMKRSTQIFSYPRARRPITPSIGGWSQPVDATLSLRGQRSLLADKSESSWWYEGGRANHVMG